MKGVWITLLYEISSVKPPSKDHLLLTGRADLLLIKELAEKRIITISALFTKNILKSPNGVLVS